MKKNPKILILKPSSLGDILHTFPAVVRIAAEFPDAQIDWLIQENFSPILDFLPPVRRAILFPRKKLGSVFSFFPAFLSLLRSLRKDSYDMVLDFQGLLRSAVLARFCRGGEIVGLADPREPLARRFYHRKITVPPDVVHAVERNLFLACSALDIEFEYMDSDLPEHDEHALLIQEMLEERGIREDTLCIGIVPGARWQTKRWPPEFFAEVMNRIIDYDYRIRFILIGSGDDMPVTETIIQNTSGKNVVNCIGETNLGELVELVRRCHYVVTNDSGPMHIAAALQIPVFALFGPTDPERCGPYGQEHSVFQAELECAKCYLRQCRKKNQACHRTISPEVVADRIIKTIQSMGKR